MGRDAVNRRSFFLRALGGAGVLAFSQRSQLPAAESIKRVRLAIFGETGPAGHFLRTIQEYPNAEIVAICDPDKRKMNGVLDRWRENVTKVSSAAVQFGRAASRQMPSEPRIFGDVRQMFESAKDQFDAVVAGHSDHLLGGVGRISLQAHKHLLLGGLPGVRVSEARELEALARDKKVVAWLHAVDGHEFRRAVEVIRRRLIGDIEEVHFWLNESGPDHRSIPEGIQPVPEGLNWDLWQGPVSPRPFHADWMVSGRWRDFSGGGIEAAGLRPMALVVEALNLQELWEAPAAKAADSIIRVKGHASRVNWISFPRWEKVRWEVPAGFKRPPFSLFWHRGDQLAPGSTLLLEKLLGDFGATDSDQRRLLGGPGMLIIGSNGALAADSLLKKLTLHGKTQALLEAMVLSGEPVAESLPYSEWLEACRGGLSLDPSPIGPISELLLLANVATQFPGELEYDPVAGQILKHHRANQALHRE